MNTTVPMRSISSEAALAAVTAAVAKGHALNCRMNAAVVDVGGHLLAFLRADGAFLASADIAVDKARTATGFGMSTDDLYHAIREPEALREGLQARQGIVLFGGGFAIEVADRVVGGIGCSGGSEAQDAECARAGLEAIGM